MKMRLAAAALGLSIVAGSLVGATQVGAAPGHKAPSAQSSNYACDCDTLIASDYLNLRAGPSTSDEILLVMPAGAKVTVSLYPDNYVNGFVKARYDGVWGWAAEEYLGEGGTGGGPSPSAGFSLSGYATVNDDVNFRNGPGTDFDVHAVLSAGTVVAVSTEAVSNGFRYVQYDGVDGWIYDAYLDFDGGGAGNYQQQTMTTTTYLNLRSGGTFDHEILVVIPEGATVYASDLVVNGFRNVVYGSYEGWAHGDYLQ